MSWLVNDAMLGDLKIDEVFVEFDGPRLFTCRSPVDRVYLVAWADHGPAEDKWLYLPISAGRLKMVRSGGMPLRAAFVEPEERLFVATLPTAVDSPDRVEIVDLNALPDEWLPSPDFVLDIATPTQEPAISGDELLKVAIQEARTRFRLEVELPKYSRTEAPTRTIGQLLLLTQSVYDNFGLALHTDDPPQRGRIPAAISEDMSSSIVELRAASFVVEIAAGKLDDLFGESPFVRATQELITLLDTQLSRDDLVRELARLKPRGAKSFRKFVEGLAATGGDVKIAAAGKVLDYQVSYLDSDRLHSLQSLLTSIVPESDDREIRSNMVLVSADTERGAFGLRDSNDVLYEGKISSTAATQTDHATLNNMYDATLIESKSIDEVVGEVTYKYTLVQLSPTS